MGELVDGDLVLGRLSRRADRDRRARLEAEAIAERVTRELYTKQQELALLQSVATAANAASTLRAAVHLALEAVCRHTGWPAGHAYFCSAATGELVPSGLWQLSDPNQFRDLCRATDLTRFSRGVGLPGRVLAEGTPAWIRDVRCDRNFPRAALFSDLGVRGAFAFPVLLGSEVTAVLEFFSTQPAEPDESLLDLMAHVGSLLGRVVERERSESRIYQQLERLNALRAIDLSITGSQDLRVSLSVVVEQVRSQLGVDAAGVLTLDPYVRMLEPCVARGFHTRVYHQVRYRPDEGLPGAVASSRSGVTRHDGQPDEGPPDTRMSTEGFRSYFGAPIIAKGRVCGVLELFHRTPLMVDAGWYEFLEALAGQAAIAIDNVQLFDARESARVALEHTYDQTLEGWVRALDLRDRETEGHTRRVTEETVRLARAYGVAGEALLHVRRGALLHDIGKMAIPDEILLKPGPLTDAEWEVMRRHPQYAHDFLWPVSYLRPALDIPYCHHERWDGSGYPQGMREEEIPLVARLFAVVDVWDALRSDRPYRRPWSEERVLEYLAQQAGVQFDPEVVALFLFLRQEDAGAP